MSAYKLKNPVRIVSAAALFDGHDVSINIMRRIMQRMGAEIIHLGHNRSVGEVVKTVIEEDANAVAITSYQGGHVRYFKYLRDELNRNSFSHVKIFGGGGGVILPSEIKSLEEYGIERIYSPDDGREMGLFGMIEDLLRRSDFPLSDFEKVKSKSIGFLPRELSKAETTHKVIQIKSDACCPVLGITGPGGAGKSTLVDELVRRFLRHEREKRIAVVSVDPTKRKTGGALLGDRIRMNAVYDPRVFLRSVATRQSNVSISSQISNIINQLKNCDFDLILLETSGIGQSNSEVVDISDACLYVMTPEYGAASQLEKIDMLDFADVVAINKSDSVGALDALRDVKKQYQRNHDLFDEEPENLPVTGTVASRFNDSGVSALYKNILTELQAKGFSAFNPESINVDKGSDISVEVIPGHRKQYLLEISRCVKDYDEETTKLSDLAGEIQALKTSASISGISDSTQSELEQRLESLKRELPGELCSALEKWEGEIAKYGDEKYSYKVRDKEVSVDTSSLSLSKLNIPKIATPKYKDWGSITRWLREENFPGKFPYTAGVFPFKREGEDPTRMFAGEGGPERTNRRFHYLCEDSHAARLSTAFDSVTLYGENPDNRPDIYGKIGNAGVSVCCLDDAKILYSGFDLSDSKTSVSMTINGPASIVTSYFLNAAVDQQVEKYIVESGLEKDVKRKISAIHKKCSLQSPSYKGESPSNHNKLGLMLLGVSGDEVVEKEIYQKIQSDTLKKIRGTVQADILKEDQAQNTCIFSTKFSLRLMADMQKFFIEKQIKNFYSVSISGYHIAEAGANPISQLAFTLANGFTYIEYYLARGMEIDDFAGNLSFFFSNGIDPEYAVIGRVARRIWSKALKYRYGANERSQKLKYHIQTSGRSLHAQEISFNDIRTTLQALYAIYDNCNSLHTNAYDEAITTPTSESVRRALAIQLIINKELGLAKNENPLQGSFIIEELSDLVEQAVLSEFERLNDRGGVLGAMERMYQRSKIQEESMYYEKLKHNGDYPIVGVNTFLADDGSPTILPEEVFRSEDSEKDAQVAQVEYQIKRHEEKSQQELVALQEDAIQGKNLFARLIETSKCCTLGQITKALYEIGGQYRRNV